MRKAGQEKRAREEKGHRGSGKDGTVNGEKTGKWKMEKYEGILDILFPYVTSSMSWLLL